MSAAELLRDGGQIRVELLEVQRAEAMQAWADACKLWNLPEPNDSQLSTESEEALNG